MTLLKEKAITMIESLTDDDVAFVVKVMENLETHSVDKVEMRKRACKDLQKFRGRLKADFDYKKELSNWREERYEGSH